MNSTGNHAALPPAPDDEVAAGAEQLLVAARSGSHAAFAELQKIYSRRLFNRAFSITRNREDAEDALQDTFLRAYVALHSFEGRSMFSSWLTRIAINSALMIVRRRRARPETPLEQCADLEGDGISIDVRDNALNPEQLCDQQQRYQAMRCAIKRLDPKSRVAMSLWTSHDLPLKELAGKLGISVASAKARLHRARKRLARNPILRGPINMGMSEKDRIQ